MKIGIWLRDRYVPSRGGSASYTNRLLTLIDNYQFSDGIEICYVSIAPNDKLNREVINISQVPYVIYRLSSASESLTSFIKKIDLKIIKKRGLRKILKASNIKLMYYLQQTTILDSSFPFVSTNWDIGHRSTFSFPELIENREFENRDYFYQNILPKALMIICESETGKKELMEYTRIGGHKIRVMPIFAGNVCSLEISVGRMNNILKKIGVKRNYYFYYPAQFWAHKNHLGLLKAFKLFVNQIDNKYKLVLSGSDKGNRLYVERIIDEMGIAENVIILGFITEEEVYSLYRNATCLVMASHFGPTNMPPIEAMELGCPVACSDLGGHREILGENAAYFDSFNEISIFKAIEDIAIHREAYVDRILRQRELTKFNENHAIECLNDYLIEAARIRENWL